MSLLAEWDALMRAVEGPYIVAIRGEKDRYITEAAQTFTSTSALVDSQFEYHVAAMQEIARKYQGRAIKLAVIKALSPIKSRIASLKADNSIDALWLYLLQKWMTEFGAQRARETAETTRDDLQRIINQALAPDVEFNPVTVAQQMLQVQSLSLFRAETIALTEVHNAMMFASQEGAAKVSRDNEVQLKKRWVPVLDERTRVNHASMASVAPIPLDADFIVGGEKMQRPGDPRASASNVIRCRCVLAYEVDE